MNTPRIGQHVTVRGQECRITRVLPMGTIEVLSLCGNYAWRVSGLPGVFAESTGQRVPYLCITADDSAHVTLNGF